MPTRLRALTRADVADVVDAAFAPPSQPLYGTELEWPVHRRDDATARPSHTELLAATVPPLPRGSRLTIEPGGQIELSTVPADTPEKAIRAAALDAMALHTRLSRAGLVVVESALDTRRAPQRILDAPRYACMEHFFAARGDAGAWMMCNTASLQINLGHDRQNPDRRWALAHRLGPVLVATFANSPGFDALGRRWESMRQAIWWSIDPGRTRPPPGDRPACEAWLDYALAADVMLMLDGDDGPATAVSPGLAFGRWLVEGNSAGWPTVDDLRYHLTTLFPPVRPRGWLELRMLDLLPARLWQVAVAVVLTALTSDAAAELEERLPATDGLWCAAARYGLTHPMLAATSRALFDAVLPALGSVTSDPQCRDDVHAFAETHVRQAISPAQRIPDDALAAGRGPTLDLEAVVESCDGRPDRSLRRPARRGC